MRRLNVKTIHHAFVFQSNFTLIVPKNEGQCLYRAIEQTFKVEGHCHAPALQCCSLPTFDENYE